MTRSCGGRRARGRGRHQRGADRAGLEARRTSRPARSTATSRPRPISSPRSRPPSRNARSARCEAPPTPRPVRSRRSPRRSPPIAARALANRRLAFALIAEPVDAAADEARLAFRAALTAEFGKRLFAAIGAGNVPEQDIAVAAPALIGALIEGLIGPLAIQVDDAAKTRDAVQALTLFALRAVGVVDAQGAGAGGADEGVGGWGVRGGEVRTK